MIIQEKRQSETLSLTVKVFNPQPQVSVKSARRSTHTPRAHSLSGIIASFSQILQTESPIPSPTIKSTPSSKHF